MEILQRIQFVITICSVFFVPASNGEECVFNWIPLKQGIDNFQKACERNASYELAKTLLQNSHNCFANIILFPLTIDQAEGSRPVTSVHEIYQPHCYRKDEVQGCIYKHGEALTAACFSDREKEIKMKRDIDSVMPSWTKTCVREKEKCFITGSVLSKEAHPRCTNSIDQPIISQCIEKSINGSEIYKMFKATMNAKNNMSAIMEDRAEPEKPVVPLQLEQCRIAYKIGTCIAYEQLKCTNSTTEESAESIFNILRSSLTCVNYTLSEIIEL